MTSGQDRGIYLYSEPWLDKPEFFQTDVIRWRIDYAWIKKEQLLIGSFGKVYGSSIELSCSLIDLDRKSIKNFTVDSAPVPKEDEDWQYYDVSVSESGVIGWLLKGGTALKVIKVYERNDKVEATTILDVNLIDV